MLTAASVDAAVAQEPATASPPAAVETVAPAVAPSAPSAAADAPSVAPTAAPSVASEAQAPNTQVGSPPSAMAPPTEMAAPATEATSVPATPIDNATDVSVEAHAAPAATSGSPAPAAMVEATKLPRDLSPWGMFMQADIIVKVVMIGLMLASVVTWTVWLAKTFELMVAKRRLRRQLIKLGAANSLSEAANLVDGRRGAVPAMIRAAVAETRASWDVVDKYAIKERIEARLERVEFAAGRDINRGTGVLATIGSTAPFVGLFGTVWGIMNSFIGISEAQTTNLAIVAPGIAEALLATAFGLIAAIPAVIVYNHFARAIGGYKALVGDASVGVLGLVSRDFDRGVRPELRAAE
ncbi:MAG: tonB-system energizer ExbB [Hyphomicrobium sp.]